MLRRFSSCYYSLLNVPKNADKETIKKAYYSLAKIHHPDTSTGTDSFKQYAEAYQTLMDDEKRYEYDLEKGYLNAEDIDRMESFREEYGTRYPQEAAWKEFQKWDQVMADQLDKDQWVLPKMLWSQTKQFKKPEPSHQKFLDNLSNFRLCALVSLTAGSGLSYYLTVLVIESFIYPVS